MFLPHNSGPRRHSCRGNPSVGPSSSGILVLLISLPRRRKMTACCGSITSEKGTKCLGIGSFGSWVDSCNSLVSDFCHHHRPGRNGPKVRGQVDREAGPKGPCGEQWLKPEVRVRAPGDQGTLNRLQGRCAQAMSSPDARTGRPRLRERTRPLREEGAV